MQLQWISAMAYVAISSSNASIGVHLSTMSNLLVSHDLPWRPLLPIRTHPSPMLSASTLASTWIPAEPANEPRVKNALSDRFPIRSTKFVAKHVMRYKDAGAGLVFKISFPKTAVVGDIGSLSSTVDLLRQQFAQ